MTLAASFASGTPMALDTNGTVREARGIHLDDIQIALLHGELDVHQAAHVEFLGQRLGRPA